MNNDLLEKLQHPFSKEDVEWRVERAFKAGNEVFAYVLAYITNRAIMQRLDSVFGPLGWSNQFTPWKDKGQLCGISVWDEDKKEWVTKWDGADSTNIESTKGGLSGSMKRAAVQWGIGRYLYGLDSYKVKIQTRGKNYISAEVKNGNQRERITGYWDEPELPKWALPNQHKESHLSVVDSSVENVGDFKITIKGKPTKLSEMNRQTIEWLAEKAQDDQARAMASAYLDELAYREDQGKSRTDTDLFGGKAV